MPKSTCLTCHKIIPEGESYCPDHKAHRRRGRNSAAYRRARAQWLHDHPVCVDCGQVGDQWLRGEDGQLWLNKLSVDHLDPLAKTNGRDTGRWVTRCVRCNVVRSVG